ncbi:androglobin-like isoform X5 [Brachionus plicatilis]|uniref:Androglobin-like isoform X5 n=1 Tax=Brachionus plicatilis TaxID=10195 RepID=A0A3M7SF24_BRAPC|nr:androglobin-like isoform X5 [Brachionus plicatilis]
MHDSIVFSFSVEQFGKFMKKFLLKSFFICEESCRFIDQALHISKCLNEAIKNFNDPEKQKASMDLLYARISPLTDDYRFNEDLKELSSRSLYDTFQSSFYEMLRKALNDVADSDMAYAWKTFMFDTTSSDLFLLKDKRPETSSTNRGSAKKIEKKSNKDGPKADKADKQTTLQPPVQAPVEKPGESLSEERTEYWKHQYDFDNIQNDPTPEESICSVKIQSAWRGCFVRKMLEARTPGTSKNLQVTETLKKSWSIIEQNLHENSLFLFRQKKNFT